MGELKRILDGKGADGWPLDGIPGWVLSYLAPLNAKARGERLTELHAALLTALQAREEENARLSSECGKLASRCLHEAQGKQALQSALAEALGAMERIMSVETYPAAFLIAREARERLTNGGRRRGMKTEYHTDKGAVEAYIVESGEFFWGDNPQTVERQRAQIVRPISYADAILNLAPVAKGAGAEPGAGWVYNSPDTGMEYSTEHPLESGEIPDATDVRRSTFFEDWMFGEIGRLDAKVRELVVNLAPVGGRGEEGSSSRADLSPASRSPDQHSAGWRCRRCGRDEIDCQENGCPRGPCPMEFVG